MFPLIPALILLLLNGPANVQQLAADGRLPAALAAIQGRIESKATAETRDADQVALASLLALSGDPDAAFALAQILLSQDSGPEPAEVRQASAEAGLPEPLCPRSLGKPQNGIGTSLRLRDGPLSR